MKHYLITLFFLFSLLNSFGQAEQEKINKQYAGGSFGIQIGTITNIDLAPHYGYFLTKNLSIGIGGTYQYFKDTRYIPEYQLHIYGGRAFARYDILNIVFLHVEQEMLAYKTDLYSLNRETELIVSHNTLVGGGYRQAFQKNSRSAGYIMLLFNLNETIHTPYSNPVLRVGFEQHF